jgi:long-chain acyl-CoA synthetase
MSAANWSAHYEPGVPQTLPEPAQHGSFHEILEAAAADAPSYRAIECYNRGTRFAELDALADRVATALERDGFGRGSVALVVLPNGLHLAATALGVLKSGGIIAPLSPSASDEALAAAVRHVEPAVAFTTVRQSGAVGEVLAELGGQLVVARPESALPASLRFVFRLGSLTAPRASGNGCRSAVGWRSWVSPAADATKPDVAPDDPAFILLDVDDGRPVCVFSHRHLVGGAAQLRGWLTDAIPGEDTWLILEPLVKPLGFVAGLGASVMLRSRVALLPSWEVRDVLDALHYLRPTYVTAGGAAMRDLVRDRDLGRADMRSVRAWLVGQPVDEDVAKRFADATGVSICRGFGPPCTAGLAACNPVNSRRASGSVGLPMPGNDVRLVGADGAVLPSGQPGLLELRGPNVAADGEWLDTGVEARCDAAGFLYLDCEEDRPIAAERTRADSRVL